MPSIGGIKAHMYLTYTVPVYTYLSLCVILAKNNSKKERKKEGKKKKHLETTVAWKFFLGV